MLKTFTCIICPNGCEITADVEENGQITKIEGATCSKGEDYVKQELTDPRRNIATRRHVFLTLLMRLKR